MKMKLVLACMLIFGSISSFACSCEGPNFSAEDVDQAVLSFVTQKLNVEENKIMALDKVSEEGFIPAMLSGITGVLSLGLSEAERSCDIGLSLIHI